MKAKKITKAKLAGLKSELDAMKIQVQELKTKDAARVIMLEAWGRPQDASSNKRLEDKVSKLKKERDTLVAIITRQREVLLHADRVVNLQQVETSELYRELASTRSRLGHALYDVDHLRERISELES